MDQDKCVKKIEELQNKIIHLHQEVEVYQQQYHNLFENDHVISLLINPENGQIVDANTAACNFYGYPKAQLLLKKIADLNISSEEEVYKEMTQAKNEERSFFYFRHKLADGQIKDVEVYSRPINLKGQLLLYSVINDITVRKKAERALELAYKELHQIFNTTAYAMRVIGKDYKMLRINNKCSKLLNLTSKKAKEKKCYEVFPGPFCFTTKCPLSRVLNGEEFIECEEEKFANNTFKSFIMTATPLRDTNGDLIGIVQSYKDITERKKYEKNIKESEERYRKLFELSPDANVIHINQKILFINSAAKKLFKVKSSKELIGKQLIDLIHPDDRRLTTYRIKQLQQGKDTPLVEYRIKRTDGTVIDVEVKSNSFVYFGQKAVHTVFRDISSRKRELEKAALIQKQNLEMEFPLQDKVELEVIYKPAEQISGDFFYFSKFDDNNVIGILGDVSGKGLSAALNNSAIKVLFYEKVAVLKEPLEILHFLNQEVEKYLNNEYIAACCFRFNFKKNQLKVAGGGISKFFLSFKGQPCVEKIIRGPFLGMVRENLFDQLIIDFKKGDRFYFCSDGVEEYIDDLPGKLTKIPTLKEQKKFLEDYLSKGSLKDDSTWLGIEIK